MNSKLGKSILCNTEDIAKEYSELALDYFFDEGVLKNIPVVGSISSIIKTGYGIRDALFYKKLATFLYNMNDIPKENREKFNDKALKDDKDFSEKLIYTLDRIDENKKVEYLAKLYKGYSNDTLNYTEFRKCCIALTQLYIGDLDYLKNNRIYDYIGDSFTTFGLYKSSMSKGIGSLKMNEKEYFEITDLGFKMRSCIF
ncbi:hypothetical protein [Paraclostridium bifermentans]|uniref:hypothetical protein n=1 Tax=Paraclostridium bifermentans TaxID=1490 RepID=UPI0018970B85|nr:hypothetical protein [Paraclostridium bifermentans]